MKKSVKERFARELLNTGLPCSESVSIWIGGLKSIILSKNKQ